jgi:predicted histidine transporter YuiF (NhaC family)
MSLKTVRVIQWLLGALLIVYGIYLIFGVQEFFGTLAIIAAFFIFPSLGNGRNSSHSNDYVHDYESDSGSPDDSGASDGGEDSGEDGGGGD